MKMKTTVALGGGKLDPQNLCLSNLAIGRWRCCSAIGCKECHSTSFSRCAAPGATRRPNELFIEGIAGYAFSLSIAIWFQRHPIDCVLTVCRHIRDSCVLVEKKIVHHLVSSQILRNAERRESFAVHPHPHEELEYSG